MRIWFQAPFYKIGKADWHKSASIANNESNLKHLLLR